ncbi:MAG: preprotein translocase subunit YajC [Phycisphaerae bacterium]|nr:preprotein translocase subunit YajC [Phycisphaerae bacterium]
MEDNLLFDFILAQADTGTPGVAPIEGAGETTVTEQPGDQNGIENKKAPTKKEGFDPMQLVPILLMVAVMYFFVFRGPKKRQNEQKKMMDELKKNDRIQTIGGIRGTIVDVRDDDEVVIKIDESNNTKIRLARRAIATIITDDQPGKK